MDANETPPRLSLLGLPSEFRAQIYHAALVEDDFINFYRKRIRLRDHQHRRMQLLDWNGCIEPGLLRCCRSIRSEARAMFLEENRFKTQIRANDLKPPPRHWFWQHLRSEQREIRWFGSEHWNQYLPWQDFVPWLHLFWTGKIAKEEVRELLDLPLRKGLSVFENYEAALKTVDEMRESPWESIETVLEFHATFANKIYGSFPP